METDAPLITQPEQLTDTIERLRRHDWFALDTEFIRETTYWPRLCLIQVATPDTIACIDPLALDDLEPLIELLYDPAITKVLHAAGQDLEIFHHRTGAVPAPVFDTQLAAPLLGYPEQAGFARLVQDCLGVELGKGHARTDWSRRPLPEAVLEYAADDVRYLVPLYEQLRDDLDARGRRQWLQPDFARLTEPARYAPPVADAWLRIKGNDKLRGRARAVLRALAEWRETTARERDVPRGRVARDDVLVDIARAQPTTREQLGQLRSVRGALEQRHGDRLIALVGQAREEEPPPLPARRGAPKLDETGEALVDSLSALVRLRAGEVDLNPATLASRKQLARIAQGDRVDQVLAGWRAEVVGEALAAFVDGRTALATVNGRLQTRPQSE